MPLYESLCGPWRARLWRWLALTVLLGQLGAAAAAAKPACPQSEHFGDERASAEYVSATAVEQFAAAASCSTRPAEIASVTVPADLPTVAMSALSRDGEWLFEFLLPPLLRPPRA